MLQKLSPRFMLPTVIIVLSVMALFGWLIGRTFEAEVRRGANQEAEDQVDHVLDSLQTLDSLSTDSSVGNEGVGQGGTADRRSRYPGFGNNQRHRGPGITIGRGFAGGQFRSG